MDGLYKLAQDRLEPYKDRNQIIKGFSVDVARTLPDNSLDFVYIDGNHEFQHVVNDMCEWYKKVRPGGILAGHDYIRRRKYAYLMHVIPAVHAFIDVYGIRPLFLLGRSAKIEGETRESIRSWFIVKP
jgi:hypothetical protein